MHSNQPLESVLNMDKFTHFHPEKMDCNLYSFVFILLFYLMEQKVRTRHEGKNPTAVKTLIFVGFHILSFRIKA
ncbi:hypothetical protein AS034_06165 [[Bacillus] enclensis]|nr:hypothetical protein AS034_06165 [[Bacillus] enclensis]